MNEIKSCNGCPYRTIEPFNCHSVCTIYLGIREKLDEDNKRNRLLNNQDVSLSRACEKVMKHKQRKSMMGLRGI